MVCENEIKETKNSAVFSCGFFLCLVLTSVFFLHPEFELLQQQPLSNALSLTYIEQPSAHTFDSFLSKGPYTQVSSIAFIPHYGGVCEETVLKVALDPFIAV